jgi:lipopolysaccharide transport system permease protein
VKDIIMAILKYRGFIWSSVKRDFQSRYQMSMLGATWLVLQPLAMITVYTVIFSQLMQARLPQATGPFAYSIYLCSGILTWGLFAEILSRMQVVFIENANLLKKVTFPRICLPVIIILSCILNYLIIFSLFIVFLVITGNFPGISFLYIIPILLVQILFASGLGITLGVLNVFFRDVGQFVTVLLQFWFWFTPVVYVYTTLPIWAQGWLNLNPMTSIINGYHDIFVHNTVPNFYAMKWTILIALLFCALGLYLFRKHAADMVDEL